jgi:hypothetical protein
MDKLIYEAVVLSPESNEDDVQAVYTVKCCDDKGCDIPSEIRHGGTWSNLLGIKMSFCIDSSDNWYMMEEEKEKYLLEKYDSDTSIKKLKNGEIGYIKVHFGQMKKRDPPLMSIFKYRIGLKHSLTPNIYVTV